MNIIKKVKLLYYKHILINKFYNINPKELGKNKININKVKSLNIKYLIHNIIEGINNGYYLYYIKLKKIKTKNISFLSEILSFFGIFFIIQLPNEYILLYDNKVYNINTNTELSKRIISIKNNKIFLLLEDEILNPIILSYINFKNIDLIFSVDKNCLDLANASMSIVYTDKKIYFPIILYDHIYDNDFKIRLDTHSLKKIKNNFIDNDIYKSKILNLI